MVTMNLNSTTTILPFIAEIFSRVGFVCTCIFNIILIYLTAFHTERITGAYKYLIILFSLVCISFSCLEVLAHPYLHNYNGGFIYFSLNDYLGASQALLRFFIEAYSGAYAAIMCMVAVQFVFRFATLMNRRTLLSTFTGFNFIIWIIYPLIFCVLFGAMTHYCAQAEPFSDDYMEKELRRVYNLDIEKTARFIVIAYNADGFVRWFNLVFLFGAMIILSAQYAVIIYCGVQMQMKMKKELKNFSLPNRKLQQQFFKALVVQITLPTLLFHLPALPVLFSPFFNIEFTFQTGFIYAVFSLYPPIETIAFMMIVSEYSNIFKKKVLRRPSAPDVNKKRISSDISIH
ncbi:CRE-STR-38 protein [Caenorhabditis remanei]|uniref:CRE-STR-38 protein n=1 Tax=Caenorhabditis remanei TaxID=31234 RepID=E3NAW9_CAERE|nr:CRE-STR-38 protein [Caenorhabditis remanei]